MQARQQEWRRRAAPRAASDTGNTHTAATPLTASESSLFPHSTRAAPPTAGHTVASASKIVRKSTTLATDMHAKPRSAPLPPSRWKELRQSVRIKATMDSSERRVADAKIVDLCDEDREKVAKLIRRIVEIGTLQEEAETEFARQRSVLEAEIAELREQVKRDASELEDLSDTLKATLLKLRDYQERVLVLEESNDVETRNRLASEQTMDLLKLEVEKLRELVGRQKLEMEQRERDDQTNFTLELERLQTQLRAAQDELLHERRERIQEKQRELDERLKRSIANGAVSGTAGSDCLDGASSSAPSTAPAATAAAAITLSDSHQPTWDELSAAPHLNVSSLLNTSVELPERIKDIMDEWKQRMQDAIAGSVQNISRQAATSDARDDQVNVSVRSHGVEQQRRASDDSCNSDSDQDHTTHRTSAANGSRSEHSQQWRRRGSLQLDTIPSVTRVPFDRYLSITSESERGNESDSDSKAQYVSARRQISRDDQARRTSSSSRRKKLSTASLSTSDRQRRVSYDRRTEQRSRREAMARVPASAHRRKRRANGSSGAATNGTECSIRGTRYRSDDEQSDSDDESDGEEGNDNELDADGERSGVASPAGTSSSQLFVLLTEPEGGCRADANSSFGNLYESSLFDVVDALEGAAAVAVTSKVSAAHSPLRSPLHRQCSSGSGAADASPASARLQSLLQGMAMRERKLARLAAHTERPRRDLDANQRHHSISSRDDADDDADECARVDADLDLFNDVKDVYATEFFASRAPHHRNVTDSSWRDSALALASDLAFDAHSSLGPPLSPQDLSVRDAIEKDMAELLLRDDALSHIRQ